MELFVRGKSFSTRSCTFYRSRSKRDLHRRPCPVLSAKCPVGLMSCRPNVLSADCPVDLISYRPNVLSANCLVDQMSCLLNVCRWKISLVKQTSVGLVSVGQLSVGQTSEHQRTCYCLARAHEETNRHIILAYTLIKQEVSNSEPKINLYNSKQTYKFWNISLEILSGSLGNFVSEFWNLNQLKQFKS